MNTTINNDKSKTLWVGDIENWMEEKFLYATFSEYAPVKGVKLMRDRNTGMTLGYGFVEFETFEMASAILNNCNGKTIPNTNKLFKLNWASYGSAKNKISHQSINSNYMTSNNNVNNMINSVNNPDYSIYVGDLDISVSETLLKDFFLKFYDSVIATKIIMDPVTKVSKGYGFVKFKDYEQSQRALNEMNGKLFINKTMKTNQAAWKKINTQESNSFNNYNKNTNNNHTYNNGNSSQKYYCNNDNNLIPNQNQNIGNFNSNVPQNNINYSNSSENLSYLQNQYQQIYMNNLYKNYYNQLNNNNNVNGQNINVEVGKESTLIQNNTSNYVGQNINPLFYQNNYQQLLNNNQYQNLMGNNLNPNDYDNK